MTTDKGPAHNDKPAAANTAKVDSTDLILSVLTPHPKAAEAKVEPKPAESKVEQKPAPAAKADGGDSPTPHKAVDSKTAPTTLMASSLLLGGNRDVVLPKKSDEPAPAATLGSMSTSFKTGFVSNLAHQADGLQTMISGKMTEQERYEQAKYGIAPERKNALSNLFHTGQNLVVNADKIPGALASQVKDTASALASGDGNKIASTLGSATAFGLTTFAPVGGLSKAGTAGREAATLANGMREVGTARAVVGEYASVSALTKLDDVSALTRLPRIPSSTAMREATSASTSLGKSVFGVVPEAKLATAFKPAGLGDDLANVAAKTTHVVPETALVKPIKPANLVADPVVAAPKTVVPEANLPAALKPGSVADEAANALLKTEGLGLSKPLHHADDVAAGTAGRTNNAGTSQHADAGSVTAKPAGDKTTGAGAEPVVKTPDTVVGKTVEPVVVKPQLVDDLNSVGTKSTEFGKAIEEAMPNMTASQRQVAQKLVDDLKVVEQTAKPVPAAGADSVVAAPVEASTKVKSLVDDLSRQPEVAKLVADHPTLASHFDDLKAAGGKLESPVVPAKTADTVVPGKTADTVTDAALVQKPEVVVGKPVEPVVVKPQLVDDLNSVGTKSTKFSKAIEEAMPNMTASQRQVAQKLVDDLKVVEQTAKPVPAGGADSVVAAPVEASTKVKSLVDDLSRRPEVAKLIQENPALASHFDDLKAAGGKLESPVVPAKTAEVVPGKAADTVVPDAALVQKPEVVVGKPVEPVVVKPQLVDDLNSVGTKSTEFSKAIEEAMPNMTASQRQVAQKLVDDLKVVEQTAKPVPAGGADSVVAAPVEASTKVKSLVDDLSRRPEVAKLIQENPALASHFDDLKAAGGKLESPVVPAKTVDTVVPGKTADTVTDAALVQKPEVVVGKPVEPVVVKPQLADDLNSVGTKSTEFSKAIEEAMPNMTASQRQVAQKLVDDLKVVEQTAKPLPAGGANSVVSTPVEASTKVKSLVDDLSRQPEVAKLIQENPALARHLDDLKVAGGKLESPVVPAKTAEVVPGQTADTVVPDAALVQKPQVVVGKTVEPAVVKPQLADDLNSVGTKSTEFSKAIEEAMPNMTASQRQVAQKLVDDLKVVEQTAKPLPAGAANSVVSTPVEASTRVKSLVDDLSRQPEVAKLIQENPALASHFDDLKVAGSKLEVPVTPASVETVAVKLGDDIGKVGRSTADLTRSIESELPKLSGAQRQVADDIVRDLKSLEEATKPGAVISPLENSRRIQKLVDDLGKPEYSRFFAENPKFVEGLTEVRVASGNMSRSRNVLETTVVSGERAANTLRLGEEGSRFTAKVEQLSDDLRRVPASDKALNPALKEVPSQSLPLVERELKAIGQDMKAIGTNTDRTIAQVRARLEILEESGAKTLARDLRTGLDDIEKLSLNARTSTRLETATLTVEREGALISQKATALSRDLKPAADLAPSTSAKIPVEAQVSKHLDSLAEQARIVGTSSDPVKAVSNMRNSINKIEELGGVRVLKPEQVKAYEEITAAVSKIDRAAVEIRGVEALRGGATNSIEKLPGLVDDLRTSVRPSVKEELAQNFRRIEEAQAELRGARTLEEQSVANSRLARELDDPKLKTLIEASGDAKLAHSRLVEQVGKIDDAVLLANRERLLTRVEAQSDNLIQGVRNLEPAPPVVSGPVNKPSPLKLATDDYVQAVNDIRRGADANALRRADQALANLEFSATRQSIAPEVLAAVKQEHKALTTVSRELSEVSNTLITRNVEKLEQGFSRMEQATSTLVQRGLIKENYNVIQDLRYIEGPKGAGAPRLEDAQNRLIRAANDIEVATYRSNLVKLASHGDQVALDKLLVSGLVPEGKKVISLVPESMSQSLSTRAFLLGFGPEGNMIRNLSAADPFFLNNRGLLLNSTTVGTLKYGLLGAFGYMEAKELSSRIDQALLLEQFEKLKKEREEAQSQERGDAAGNSQTRFDPTDNKAAASPAQIGELPQVLPRRAVQFNLNPAFEQTSSQLYAQAGAANYGINPVNAQSVMRNAYAGVVQNRTLPSQNGLTTGAPLKTGGNRERSVLNVRFDDPDREQKIFNMATYGTEFGPYRQGSLPSAVDVAPIARAVSFPVTFTYNGDGRLDSRLDKPASSQFVIPSILNATDARLLNLSFSGRRDPYSSNSTALGSGQGIVNASGTSKLVNDGHLYNSLIASEAEGGNGHDARKLAGMEEAEDDVDKAGSGVVASANNGNQDDDDEDGQQSAAPVQVSSGSNVPPLPASVLTGNAVVADAGKAKEAEKEKIPGPPRKKTITA